MISNNDIFNHFLLPNKNSDAATTNVNSLLMKNWVNNAALNNQISGLTQGVNNDMGSLAQQTNAQLLQNNAKTNSNMTLAALQAANSGAEGGLQQSQLGQIANQASGDAGNIFNAAKTNAGKIESNLNDALGNLQPSLYGQNGEIIGNSIINAADNDKANSAGYDTLVNNYFGKNGITNVDQLKGALNPANPGSGGTPWWETLLGVGGAILGLGALKKGGGKLWGAFKNRASAADDLGELEGLAGREFEV